MAAFLQDFQRDKPQVSGPFLLGADCARTLELFPRQQGRRDPRVPVEGERNVPGRATGEALVCQ